MAQPSPAGSDAISDTISRLRNIAETHLREIGEEILQEEKDRARRNQELERYAKQRRRDKTSTLVVLSGSTTTPTSKMRSAQDVLDRLRWDHALDLSRYSIGYLERFSGIKETPAAEWVSEFTEEEWIPQHRIKYFKRTTTETGEQEIVWDRDKRIDKIFSGAGSPINQDETETRSDSGGGPGTIDAINVVP
ncbi:hypothetical protein LTR99_005929 [Exophiala xenobiotica]|uniref:MJ1316 RNA cyclic group end recognition domain-containing protein n=1 Tax=Vermiconidia calcicola TaxID=1690605 RepID=A0AAV9QFY0_9PEZI|nr:hypothetical protein LTR96_007778 [Exophiala xenobiotica]KAK5540998.1 hypothetical protein LTR25_002775 [Vermiconidia calcicola]KAK5549510.1 hypothetical protein LTR23_000618 [Chaetothyriales sp. CCFEE 6169]KAK5302972.1 hypothetical protein LTR99_005929 [Exophiala xenobiotica]KAK5340668.1 hypothetical protein LTR98_003790 [Exophiala xenobiotica]